QLSTAARVVVEDMRMVIGTHGRDASAGRTMLGQTPGTAVGRIRPIHGSAIVTTRGDIQAVCVATEVVGPRALVDVIEAQAVVTAGIRANSRSESAFGTGIRRRAHRGRCRVN